MKERRQDHKKRNRKLTLLTAALFLAGILILWVASLRIPALEDLSVRKIDASTKLYDRTGEIMLYDFSPNMRRADVPFTDISPYLKQATLAIEDKNFYEHGGVKFTSFVRAILVNTASLSFKQGGSTITQQVVKNTILNRDKSPTRKLKEWILAVKLDKALPKDDILNIYLNEIPYGGNIYGVEEASLAFFGKHASELGIVESAYIAAIPQAPTYFSPYGSHKQALEDRKNLVLREMLSLGYITQEEYDKALAEKIEFKPRENNGSIKAPHFVFFVADYLAKKYGEDILQNGGLKVVTTLNWDIQKEAEEIANQYGHSNEKNFNGKNTAIVAIDPKTGDILSMVGSRDYFDDTIEGNFNVALAHRQPGSAFKPFVYATLFDKGYTSETVLFDVPTQFSTNCSVSNFTSENGCYAPVNYDDKFVGPMTVRNALAQSRNVPAVKALYLAGVKRSIETASAMGITSLEDSNRYGLTLVLGGGEVSLLELTSAYSVFANDGMRNPYNPILRIEDSSGNPIEVHTSYPQRVLSEQTVRQINNILVDPVARAPLYGPGSAASIPGVAVKTGTTNDYRDAWIVGYTPNIVVGVWTGNNDNSPMVKKVSGLIVAPIWRALMDKIQPQLPQESFPDPEPIDQSIKPVLRGVWWGQGGVHDILYYVNKDNPLGPYPSNPNADPQFRLWEYGVRAWAGNNNADNYTPPTTPIVPGSTDTTGGTVPTQVPGGEVPVTNPQGNVVVPGGTF